uniref:Uncharacterized protein n=1 Tax=Fundulus heteroclitus TaxID=8078 RepID=A0A3Q2QHN2_FUNHE
NTVYSSVMVPRLWLIVFLILYQLVVLFFCHLSLWVKKQTQDHCCFLPIQVYGESSDTDFMHTVDIKTASQLLSFPTPSLISCCDS